MFWKLLGRGWPVLLAWWLPLAASAQVALPLVPVRPLANLSATDTAQANLDFLRREIGEARVVFLGEPTHGEGNVLAAKAQLVAYLHQHLGFTTLAMESGFFELHKAQRAIAAGKSVPKNLQASIFPVWMQTREFQAVLPLVGPDGLRVMGFDPQLSGSYGEDLADDLEDFLDAEKGAAAIDYELLDGVFGYMGEHYAWPPTQPLAAWEAELAKAAPLLAHAANAPTASRRAEAAFWQQCLRSLGALARDYALHDPGSKDATTFVAADSNPRDAQMADNLLWYLHQHPTEKVICWGALPHFANRAEVLGNEELRDYRPMGRAVKAALGPAQVYILGTLAGGGAHGSVGTASMPVPTPAPGTLEANLLAATTTPYAFVSLRHDAPGRQLTTYAFDYQPVAGPWSEVVDGFLFFRDVSPPHLLAADSSAAPADSAARLSASSGPAAGSLNPAAGRGGTVLRQAVSGADVSGLRVVRGVVLDQRTRQPVPFASVQPPELGQGTVADAQGRFQLALPAPTPLRISSLGYNSLTVRSPAGNEELMVLLAPAAYALAEVRAVAVRPPTPEAILRRVVQYIPRNYEQRDYAAEVYTYQRVSGFDTVRLEQEQVSRLRVPAGFHDFTRGFAMHQDGVYQQVQQRHVLRAERDSTRPRTLGYLGDPQGYLLSAADPVRTSPLFKGRGPRHFQLKLDSVRYAGPDTLYVLSFAAKRANHRSTGTYLAGVYQGRLLVRRRDYAVLRYEALWQLDTATYNAVARKNQGRATLLAQLYNSTFSANRTTHVVSYARAANGRYYVRRSTGQSAIAGRQLAGKGRTFANRSLTEHYFIPLPEAGLPPVLGQGPVPRPSLPPYRPEFWNRYQRPMGIE